MPKNPAPVATETAEAPTTEPADVPSEITQTAAVVEITSAVSKRERRASQAVTQKIERIRILIEKGEYPVDLDELAAQIVEDELKSGDKS